MAPPALVRFQVPGPVSGIAMAAADFCTVTHGGSIPPISTIIVGKPDKRAGAVSKTERTFTGLGCKSSAYCHIRMVNPAGPGSAWKAAGAFRGLGFESSVILHGK